MEGVCGEREDGPTVDFLSLLPAELVLRVCLFLSSRDVTRCLLVCRAWFGRLSQLEPYWRAACAAAGLSGVMVRKFGPLHKTSRGLFLATKNYLQSLAAPPPTTVNLTKGYPFDVRYSHQYARQGCIIGTLYRDFQPREIVVERVRGGRLTRTHTLRLAFSSRSEHRVVWGSLLETQVYVCATASGRWSLYDLSSPGPVSPALCLAGDTLYDTELRLSSCERCGLVAMAKLVSFHSVNEQSFWDLRFLRLCRSLVPPTHLLHFRLHHNNADIVGRRVPHGKRWVWLLSKAPPPSPRESCSSHLLLLQWANTITSHVFSATGTGMRLVSHTPHLSYLTPSSSLDSALYDSGGLNTEFVLSSDRQLVGVVFQARLHVWGVWSGKELSQVTLPVREQFEQLRLLAVGHLLSVVGLQYSTELLLVLTLTGQVIWRCTGFAQQHSHMVPPYTELLCLSEEDWLSDITTSCPAHRRTLTFWNKTNRSLEAVLLGEEPVANDNQSPILSSSKKSWFKFWK